MLNLKIKRTNPSDFRTLLRSRRQRQIRPTIYWIIDWLVSHIYLCLLIFKVSDAHHKKEREARFDSLALAH